MSPGDFNLNLVADERDQGATLDPVHGGGIVLSQWNPGPFHVGVVRIINDRAVPAGCQWLQVTERDPLFQVLLFARLKNEELFRIESVDVSAAADAHRRWWLSWVCLF